MSIKVKAQIGSGITTGSSIGDGISSGGGGGIFPAYPNKLLQYGYGKESTYMTDIINTGDRRTQHVGYAVDFSSSDLEFIEMGSIDTPDNFIITVNFKTSSASGTICSQYDTGSSQRAFWLSINGSGQIQFNTSSNGAGFLTATTTPTFHDGIWHIVRIIKSGTSVTFEEYSNGSWQNVTSTGSATATIHNSTTNFKIGTFQSGGSTYFNGSISKLEIYDTDSNSYWGYWPLEESSGSTAYNVSGNGNHGTLTTGTGSIATMRLGRQDIFSYPNTYGYSAGGLIDEELITNGGFDTDSDWDKGTGWLITSGKAVHTGAGSYLSQDILKADTEYNIKIDVLVADGSNFIQVYMGNSPAESPSLTAPGSYEITALSKSTVPLGFALRGIGDVEIDNVSVKELVSDNVLVPVLNSNSIIDAIGNIADYSGTNPRDILFINAPCLSVDTLDEITFTDIAGGVTISSYEGTATIAIDDVLNKITVSGAGTLYNIILSDGSKFPCEDTSGADLYDVHANANHGTLVPGGGRTVADMRNATQDTTFYNEANGYNLSGSVKIPSPLIYDGDDVLGTALSHPKNDVAIIGGCQYDFTNGVASPWTYDVWEDTAETTNYTVPTVYNLDDKYGSSDNQFGYNHVNNSVVVGEGAIGLYKYGLTGTELYLISSLYQNTTDYEVVRDVGDNIQFYPNGTPMYELK